MGLEEGWGWDPARSELGFSIDSIRLQNEPLLRPPACLCYSSDLLGAEGGPHPLPCFPLLCLCLPIIALDLDLAVRCLLEGERKVWSATPSESTGKELRLSELGLFICKMGTIIPASRPLPGLRETSLWLPRVVPPKPLIEGNHSHYFSDFWPRRQQQTILTRGMKSVTRGQHVSPPSFLSSLSVLPQ